MKFIKNTFLSLVFLAFVSLGASSAKAACSTHLGDFDWDSANIHIIYLRILVNKSIFNGWFLLRYMF